MSHTGHRNVDGVHSYKRINEEQKKLVSGVLSSTSRKHDELEWSQNTKKQRLDADQSRSCVDDSTIAVSTQEATNVTLNSIGGPSSCLSTLLAAHLLPLTTIYADIIACITPALTAALYCS